MNPVVPATQFDDIRQQREADTLGMWIFLSTEVMLFGCLFLAYIIYRGAYPEAFAQASHHMNLAAGTINTALLLSSSLMVALALHFAKAGSRKVLMLLLTGAWISGLIFIGIKSYEYHAHYVEGLFPGQTFHFEGASGQGAELFFWLYFVMTGLHGVHITVGVGLLIFLTIQAWRNRIPREKTMQVEMIGLYWHFVDVIWVFLFPLFYLVDLA